MGVGRGDNSYFKGSGIEMATFRQMHDYVDILRQLWAGKHVTYDGPVGTFEDLSFAETYHGDPPPIWFGGFCHPKGAQFAAAKCDGVVLIPMMNPKAVGDAKQRIVDACQEIGRDPGEIRVGALVVTAPDMDDFEARAISAGRLVTYLQYHGYGEALCDANGWDHKVLQDIRNHKQFTGLRQVADRERHQLMEVAKVIPDEYIWDCSAIGTAEECVTNLQRFIDAGADEIVTYGSTPTQNGPLIEAWRTSTTMRGGREMIQDDSRRTDECPAKVWNPMDPALIDDPHARYRALREVDPVYFEETLGWWFVTGHEEATEVLRAPDGEMRYLDFQQMRMGRDVSEEPYCRGLSSFLPTVSLEDHHRIRGTFKKHFTPKRVQAMRDDVTATAHALLDAVHAEGKMDLCPAYTSKLPLASISKLLAIPESEQAQIAEHITHFKLAIQFLPMNDEELAKANASISGLGEQFTALIARRRENLGEDLLSVLIREADEGVLTEDELVANAWGLFAGGFDTTGSAIAGAMVQLFEHPEQLNTLRADFSLIPDAVEELLRFAGPVQAQHRIFPREITVGGHTIAPGTPIVTYLIGANRDERWIPGGEQLDVTRTGTHAHLAFGNGAHRCPGRHLATMVTEVALETLFTRLDRLRLDGDVVWDTENLPSVMPKSVPVAWHPR
jgi:hypothetical protein